MAAISNTPQLLSKSTKGDSPFEGTLICKLLSLSKSALLTLMLSDNTITPSAFLRQIIVPNASSKLTGAGRYCGKSICRLFDSISTRPPLRSARTRPLNICTPGKSFTAENPIRSRSAVALYVDCSDCMPLISALTLRMTPSGEICASVVF